MLCITGLMETEMWSKKRTNRQKTCDIVWMLREENCYEKGCKIQVRLLQKARSKT